MERGLRVIETDKTFFKKITNTIGKLFIPTKVGFNSVMISIKRNNVVKAYLYNEEDNDESSRKKYEDTYALYLESIDKYIMDSVYKKVKNNTATEFERNALADYYEVTHLKETEYLEYKYRKQKYLIDLDYETLKTQNKERVLNKYEKFYSAKMDTLYKGLLKHYSVQLADNLVAKDREEIYNKIFITLEDYIGSILPIKIKNDKDDTYKEIMDEYEKFEGFTIGKLDQRELIEKKAVLLGISRQLFTHSLPLIVAEQCYIKLLKDTRDLIVDTRIEQKKKSAYKLLINLIEDYNMRLLSTKIYWEKPAERDYYKKFWNEYKSLQPLKEENEEDYEEQKEILFIRNDLKKLCEAKNILRYEKIIKFYKEKLVSMGAMRNIKNSCKTIGNYTKQKQIA